MKPRNKTFKLWLGSMTIVTGLLVAAAPAAADTTSPWKRHIPTPEPATLILLAVGGGIAAVARRRKSGRND